MPHTETHGVIYPDELGCLETVFEEACRTLKITRGTPEAERIGLKIMLLFQSGIDDYGRLLEAAIELPDAGDGQDDLRCG